MSRRLRLNIFDIRMRFKVYFFYHKDLSGACGFHFNKSNYSNLIKENLYSNKQISHVIIKYEYKNESI